VADYLHLHWPSFAYRDRSAIGGLSKFLRFVALLGVTRVCGIRILWTAHNLYPHDRSKIPFLDRLGRRILVLLSFRIFAHGKSAASIVAREFPRARGKLVTIPHGNWIGYLADGCSRADARARLGIPAAQYVFLFIGLCKEYKNLESLVSCFQDGPFSDAALWIVGQFQDPEYHARVQARVARQPRGVRIEDRFVADEELQYYLRACDVVTLPYTDVLTSGTAMLAMSFGRPVVAPRLGYLHDVINDDCGHLYDPVDPEGLSRAMQSARQRGFDESAIRRHARDFDWQDAAQATLSALT
jgi:glycosyltransferase involved in cell wall biosynthesis